MNKNIVYTVLSHFGGNVIDLFVLDGFEFDKVWRNYENKEHLKWLFFDLYVIDNDLLPQIDKLKHRKDKITENMTYDSLKQYITKYSRCLEEIEDIVLTRYKGKPIGFEIYNN